MLTPPPARKSLTPSHSQHADGPTESFSEQREDEHSKSVKHGRPEHTPPSSKRAEKSEETARSPSDDEYDFDVHLKRMKSESESSRSKTKTAPCATSQQPQQSKPKGSSKPVISTFAIPRDDRQQTLALKQTRPKRKMVLGELKTTFQKPTRISSLFGLGPEDDFSPPPFDSLTQQTSSERAKSPAAKRRQTSQNKPATKSSTHPA